MAKIYKSVFCLSFESVTILLPANHSMFFAWGGAGFFLLDIMHEVSVHEAKANLSKYINATIDRTEDEIVIAKDGKPFVKIVPYFHQLVRFGLGKGVIADLDDLDSFNSINVESDFMGAGELL